MQVRTTASLFAFMTFMTLNAFAQDATVDKKVCIAAAERGQELRDGKKMRDARAQFLLCARKECPPAITRECSRWAAEAEAALGSVKLEVVDESGNKLTAVKVTIDGAAWSDEVPSSPVPLDPGSHEIRFEKAGSEAVVRTVSLAMGERDRVVQASFKGHEASASTTPAPAPKAEPPKAEAPKAEAPRGEGGSLVLPIALGGVGVVALGTAGTFWLLGNSDLDAARERCANGCADTQADDAKQKHLIGDIALGVGIVAIAAAAYFLVTREKAPQPVVRF